MVRVSICFQKKHRCVSQALTQAEAMALSVGGPVESHWCLWSDTLMKKPLFCLCPEPPDQVSGQKYGRAYSLVLTGSRFQLQNHWRPLPLFPTSWVPHQRKAHVGMLLITPVRGKGQPSGTEQGQRRKEARGEEAEGKHCQCLWGSQVVPPDPREAVYPKCWENGSAQSTSQGREHRVGVRFLLVELFLMSYLDRRDQLVGLVFMDSWRSKPPCVSSLLTH